jgi:hypothetical protein
MTRQHRTLQGLHCCCVSPVLPQAVTHGRACTARLVQEHLVSSQQLGCGHAVCVCGVRHVQQACCFQESSQYGLKLLGTLGTSRRSCLPLLCATTGGCVCAPLAHEVRTLRTWACCQFTWLASLCLCTFCLCVCGEGGRKVVVCRASHTAAPSACYHAACPVCDCYFLSAVAAWPHISLRDPLSHAWLQHMYATKHWFALCSSKC